MTLAEKKLRKSIIEVCWLAELSVAQTYAIFIIHFPKIFAENISDYALRSQLKYIENRFRQLDQEYSEFLVYNGLLYLGV